MIDDGDSDEDVGEDSDGDGDEDGDEDGEGSDKDEYTENVKRGLPQGFCLLKVMAGLMGASQPFRFLDQSPGASQNFCQHQCETITWEDGNDQRVYNLQIFATTGSEKLSILLLPNIAIIA